MFDNLLDLFTTTGVDLPTLPNFALMLMVSLLFGCAISMTYRVTDKNKTPSQSFSVSLLVLPLIVMSIIVMIGNQITRAISLGGVFAIIRFRSMPGDPKVITYVLFCMAVGLTAGMGYVTYGIFLTVLFCLIMVVLHLIRFGDSKHMRKLIKITVPENFSYHKVFDEILNKYASEVMYNQVRTKEFGAFYELSFTITLSDIVNEKEMIDEIRTLNGNLPVLLIMEPKPPEFIQ